MPTTLPPVLVQAPFVDARTGLLTRTAIGWLQSSYTRQGGQEAATNTELAGGVAANADQIGQVQDDLGQTNTTLAGLEAEVTALQDAFLQLAQAVEALTSRVTTLEATVATLGETVEAQETRLAALETWKAAVVAGLPAAVTVTPVPALANDPATAILLENDLTANWRPGINTNDAGVATAVNAVRDALAA